MNSIGVCSIVFASAFLGALAGMLLQRRVPKSYLEHETKEIVRLGMGLVATMAALVLGLLVSAAKSSFDEQANTFRQLALNVMLVDRTLAQFGDGASPARVQLRHAVTQTIESLTAANTPKTRSGIDDDKITVEGMALGAAIRALSPADETRIALKAQALQFVNELMRDRWRLSQSAEQSLPIPFLIVLTFWLAVLFVSFGLFSPSNVVAVLALFICAASVAGAVLLIVDLDQPFDGLVRISASPLKDTLSKLGK